MTFHDPYMMTHMVESAIVIALFAVIAICLMLTTSGGRSVLRKISRMARKHPVNCLLLLTGLWVFTAFGGSKPPPVVVEKGIELISCVQTPQRVEFKWKSDDGRITPGSVYMIQEMRGNDWFTIGTTTATEFVHPRFTVHQYNRWRIAVDITEASR